MKPLSSPGLQHRTSYVTITLAARKLGTQRTTAVESYSMVAAKLLEQTVPNKKVLPAELAIKKKQQTFPRPLFVSIDTTTLTDEDRPSFRF